LVKIDEIQKRRRARELTLQMCYLLDIRRIEEPEKVMQHFETLLSEQKLENDEYTLEYARELISGIVENRLEIDGLIRMNVTGWRPERMGIIDRAAVYIALYEGIVGRKVDVPVAISEAMNLARLFGSEESARFVNGVLGKIVRAVGMSHVDPDLLLFRDDTSTEK